MVTTQRAHNAWGICIGAVTLSAVQMTRHPDGPVVTARHALPHAGDPQGALAGFLGEHAIEGSVAITGRRLAQGINLTLISEPMAVERAYRFLHDPATPHAPAIVSAGGETFLAYLLDATGHVMNVVSGNKCASGTGEFFLQQLGRLDIPLSELADWDPATPAYEVSGRCSVFCKSDCTHATNKGVPKPQVVAGLARMMAKKVLELLAQVPEKAGIWLVGGASLNTPMVAALREEIPDLWIPPTAHGFEALGAALHALEQQTRPLPARSSALFQPRSPRYHRLGPLTEAASQVDFKQMPRGTLQPGESCILGLDVGSTTTKAVLLRPRDQALVAAVYLRTNGDPVAAARACYREIMAQVTERVGDHDLPLIGLGTTGSGRAIAGLHAASDDVVNEIIAHAAAAAHFDPEVDTLFEIGGQDAKYTLLAQGVPVDYAMNEACAAGTGSFLEEAARETLDVPMAQIAESALAAPAAPNFSDQCSAFIAADIQNAVQEGWQRNEVMAGLVYAIAQNYLNRVKGPRPVGHNIFMQGGVCYNRAVPLAMAKLLGRPIVVPPDPGLMGAFGVALVVARRIERGQSPSRSYDLAVLAERDVKRKSAFICGGGRDKCDRKCEVSRLQIAGRTRPFGGACSLYDNLRRHLRVDQKALNLVQARQELIWDPAHRTIPPGMQRRGRIGMSRSFMMQLFHPLFATFFARLGFEPVLADEVCPAGVEKRQAPFCYPAEQSHGWLADLLQRGGGLDGLFLPHIKALPAMADQTSAQLCPLVQGEGDMLKATFARELTASRLPLHRPLLDFTRGLDQGQEPLLELARRLGVEPRQARAAWDAAHAAQHRVMAANRELGRKFLAELKADPARIGVVLLSRPYNGLTRDGHMGIPNKLASRGIPILPFDALPLEGERSFRHMYWGSGQGLLAAARLVARHPQLYALWVSNFSCGPDSFLIGYFRDLMGRKPCLTLELDSHTADAGLETRIEAFLDIIAGARAGGADFRAPAAPRPTPARVGTDQGGLRVTTGAGEVLPLTDSRVTILVPEVGEIMTRALVAAFRSSGYHAVGHPPNDAELLALGRSHSSGKECLPLTLTVGTLINYTQRLRRTDEVVVYFMPTASGPCRFGQYSVFMEDLIRNKGLADVALLSPTSENSYGGLGPAFTRRAWWATILADELEDMRAMLLANASDGESAMALFRCECSALMASLEHGEWRTLCRRLEQAAENLATIPLRRPIAEVPVVSLSGEIYVRREPLSRQFLTERLAQRGIAVSCVPTAEWLHYSDNLVTRGLVDYRMGLREGLMFHLKRHLMERDERTLKRILARAGLTRPHPIPLAELLRNGARHVAPALTCETILTVGGALTDVATRVSGVIAMGPFGCMPNRLAESILKRTMHADTKRQILNGDGRAYRVLEGMGDLPFLAIESDGAPFSQTVEARLEAFCLQVDRLHRRMRDAGLTG